MALILNIDTALEVASISLSSNGQILIDDENSMQKDHAAWLHPAIQKLMNSANKEFKDLAAIAVNYGPGSYTGLRVGLSAAKGFCYSLDIPLITVSSLKILASSALKKIENQPELFPNDTSLLIAPMIDARRMEVYTAIYDLQLREMLSPRAMILSPDSFTEFLKWQKILFLGNGSIKFQLVCKNINAYFQNLNLNSSAMAEVSYNYFIGNNFAGMAYAEPLYLKEFYTRQ